MQFSFDAVPAVITKAALFDDRFDFSKRELKVIWYLASQQPVVEGELAPLTISDAELGRLILMDKSHLCRVLRDLADRRILRRSGGTLALTMDPNHWVCQDEAVAKTATKSGQNGNAKVAKTATPDLPPEDAGVAKTATASGQNGNEKLPKRQRSVAETATDDPPQTRSTRPSTEAPIEESKKDTLERSIPPELSLMREHVGTAMRVMRERGFAKPPGQADPGFAFKHYVESVLMRRGLERSASGLDPLAYLSEYILPALADVPERFLVDFVAYDNELTYKLGRLRELGVYLNLWSKPATTEPRGMTAVSDFSSQEEETVSDL